MTWKILHGHVLDMLAGLAAGGGIAVMSFFDLLDSSPAFVFVVLALAGFLAIILHAGPRVALQTAALIAILGGVGVAVGWLALVVSAWVSANPQMAVGIGVGFVVGLAVSLAAFIVLRAVQDGDKGGDL